MATTASNPAESESSTNPRTAAVKETAKRVSERTNAEYEQAEALAEAKASELLGDTRGQNNMMDRGINIVTSLLVVGLLTAYLLPIVLDELNAVDTSSWGDAEASLYGLLGLFFVLAIVIFVIRRVTE